MYFFTMKGNRVTFILLNILARGGIKEFRYVDKHIPLQASSWSLFLYNPADAHRSGGLKPSTFVSCILMELPVIIPLDNKQQRVIRFNFHIRAELVAADTTDWFGMSP